MKMIISIPDDAANKPLENNLDFTHTMLMALMTGKRLPDNPTNGNIIETLFPDTEFEVVEKVGNRLVYMNNERYIAFDLDWWNAPYKGE